MSGPRRIKLKNISILIISVIAFITLTNCNSTNNNEFRLPIYTPADLDPDWVDPSLKNSTDPHIVNDFEFINQDGILVNEQTVEGKIYIAEFFFTTCPGICPTLTKHTKKIQNEFMDDNDILILSHTVYPEHDSVAVLHAFAEQNNINSTKWHLLTGSKQDIYTISQKGYFAISYQPDLSSDGFIHTENVVLVDKHRRLRGIYNGTNAHEMNRLIEDIYLLKKEYQI